MIALGAAAQVQAGSGGLSTRAGQRLPCAHRVEAVRLGLLAFGGYHLAVGLFMVLAPGAFFDLFAPFGARNDHYVRDMATFEFPLGAALVAAASRPRWRVPVLSLVSLHWVLHTLNRVADVGDADPMWLGVAAMLALVAGTATVLWLLAHARRAERWSGSR